MTESSAEGVSSAEAGSSAEGVPSAEGVSSAEEAGGQHKSTVGWLELFFDLVVVAAVSVLTAGLPEHVDVRALALTAVVYVAIWTGWSLTVFYANLAQDRLGFRTVTESMFLIAVMTAAAPVHEDARANVFAVAFLVLRGLLSRSSMRTGRVLMSWPMLQVGGATLPWLVSLFVDTPLKYWLWAIGLALDLAFTMLDKRMEDTDQALSRIQQRADQHTRRSAESVTLVAVDVDREHLEERLGLFVIIVLGESVIQVVHSAATTVPWTGDFLAVAVACFLILIGLWRHAFVHGFTGTPHTTLAQLPPRVGLPMHLVATGGLVALAAGMAGLLHGPEEHVPTTVAWLVGGGLAAYFGVGLAASVVGRAPLRWVLGWAGASTAYSLMLALVGPHLATSSFAWLAAAPSAWLAFSGWAVEES